MRLKGFKKYQSHNLNFNGTFDIKMRFKQPDSFCIYFHGKLYKRDASKNERILVDVNKPSQAAKQAAKHLHLRAKF